MSLKRRNGPRAIAALILFSIAQVGLQVGLAEPTITTTATTVLPQVIGRLTTRNNQPIQVNGLSATTGASILSGATLETGADQSAIVKISGVLRRPLVTGTVGAVEIAPNSKVVLTFDEQGNLKALVMFGCVKVSAERNATGEVAIEQGSLAKTDPASGGDLELRYDPGSAPAVGPGACKGPGPIYAAGSSGGLFGLGVPATIAVVAAGTAAGLTPLFFPDDQVNPSGPSN
ncbi:MAG TPA: hypothetical protein VFR51_04960 [Pyrinomonadaceae bacterium]|nr:hypothetical protein [Pyrinomonadaceae bacterium]